MPWLLPLLPALARVAAFVYYRVRYAGEPVPSSGPVLLVANHPNALLDPMLVVAAARRPVRFLAKAPLFHDPRTAWLAKGAGAIPVYRRLDDPTQTGRNVDSLEAVHDALARRAAVGIFPEGLSHSEPALAPLRTGAARMALGAAHVVGGALPPDSHGAPVSAQGRVPLARLRRHRDTRRLGRPRPARHGRCRGGAGPHRPDHVQGSRR